MFEIQEEFDAPLSISRREYFVGVLLQGLMTRYPSWPVGDLIVRACTEADAVIEELERVPVD